MAKEDLVETIAKKLVVFDKHPVADIMAAQGIWKAGASATNNTYKALCNLVDLGKLEKIKDVFRLPGCKSEYVKNSHSQFLTSTLAGILKVFPDSIIYREHTIREKNVGLRPDALCLLIQEGKGMCLWLEVCNHESPEYFEKKRNVLKSWDALPYLSQLFNYQIPAYHLVKDSELATFLEEKHE